MPDMDGQRGNWAECFEQLLTTKPPSGLIPFAEFQSAEVYLPTNKSPPSLNEAAEVVAILRNEKATGICKVDENLLKTGSEGMIRKLHVIWTAVWQPAD